MLTRLACATLLIAGATPALPAEPPLTLDRLMAELAGRGPGTVRFTEVKSSALLKAPIESSGTSIASVTAGPRSTPPKRRTSMRGMRAVSATS